MNSDIEVVYLSRPAVMRKIDGVLSNYKVTRADVRPDPNTGGLTVAFLAGEAWVPMVVRFIPHVVDRETGDELRASLLRSIGHHLNRY